MSVVKKCLAVLAAIGLATAAPALAKEGNADHPEARNYDASIDASAAVDSALERARASNKLVLIALGANWCHDSRAFAGWMESDYFAELIELHFELVHVNVGMPQTKDGHNLHIAERFGVADIKGTPTVLIVSPQGELLNGETAKAWRNTASRSAAEIFVELAAFAANRTAEQPTD